MPFYPPAIWRAGPVEKQGYPGFARNLVHGVICHSMVGSMFGALRRLADVNDRASWHFSVGQDGRVWQHYDTLAVTWHAGSLLWNSLLIGIEHEGGPAGNEGEPLTDKQRTASVSLVHWLSDVHGFSLARFNGHDGSLFEHNQVYETACPSGRIPWDAYLEEGMKPFLVWATDTSKLYLVGPWGASWITDQNDVPVLEGLYGKATVVLHESTLRSINTRIVTGS